MMMFKMFSDLGYLKLFHNIPYLYIIIQIAFPSRLAVWLPPRAKKSARKEPPCPWCRAPTRGSSWWDKPEVNRRLHVQHKYIYIYITNKNYIYITMYILYIHVLSIPVWLIFLIYGYNDIYIYIYLFSHIIWEYSR